MSDKWDGVERRKVDKDWLDRDRLLSDIDANVKQMVKWAERHDVEDDTRFKAANDRIAWIEKVAWTGIGGLAVLNILLKVIHI